VKILYDLIKSVKFIYDFKKLKKTTPEGVAKGVWPGKPQRENWLFDCLWFGAVPEANLARINVSKGGVVSYPTHPKKTCHTA
jgi:hypothetical protein